ncbi:hypothetical protein KX816_16550 [Sphingosinicellaceae bacterium]|nr:hypothetical protein KX816_16550 [Sphingosinicellaceae bacterium]
MTVANRIARNTGIALVLSLALASAPAEARRYGGYHGGYHNYHRGGGIGLGGALLGAAIIGGIAVAASNNNRDQPPVYYGDPSPQPGYAQGYEPEVYGEAGPPPPPEALDGRNSAENGPVEDCTRAAEQQAETRGGRAHVTGIDRVDPIEGGANVLGYLEIDRGQNAPLQRLGFSCRAAYGQVTGIRLG